MTRRLWIDVDMGIDDALAVLLACHTKAVEVIAISAVAGNVPVRTAAANTTGLLRLLGRADVPVFVGADRPLRRPMRLTDAFHGPNGIGYARVPEGASPQPGAAQHLVEAARARPGELDVVALGPLTNVAHALRLCPQLPSLLRSLTVMGGAYHVPGNMGEAEFNFAIDPEAAHEVLHAWTAEGSEAAPATLVGLDVTESALVDGERLAGLGPDGSGRTPLSRFLSDSLRFKMQARARTGLAALACVHDALAMWIATEPAAVFTARPSHVSVVTETASAGRAIARDHGPFTVVVGYDAQGFARDIERAVRWALTAEVARAR